MCNDSSHGSHPPRSAIPCLRLSLLPSARNGLLPQHLRRGHETTSRQSFCPAVAVISHTHSLLFPEGKDSQPPVPAAQAPHALGLHACHANQILEIGEVSAQLRKLCVEMRLLRRQNMSALPLFLRTFGGVLCRVRRNGEWYALVDAA